MITFKNITKEYKIKKQLYTAIDDVSFTINDHEIVGIVGYSGAGKSTLIRLINGLIKPTSGDITMDEEIINKLSNHQLRNTCQKIGMIFQHFNLLNQLTAFENVKIAAKIAWKHLSKFNTSIDDLVSAALNSVGLLDKKNKYPAELSGGEKQRVAIARAIVVKPKYLLCDEATSSLDPANGHEIVKILKKIHHEQNFTIVFISHQVEIVKDLCNRILVMDKGKIIEDQSTLNLFTKPINPITKKLITNVVLDENFLLPKNNKLYQIIYKNNLSEKAILSAIIKKYDVTFDILYAKSITIEENMIGYLYVTIAGKQIAEAIKILKTKGLEVNAYV
jgi:D-methionine transport system ATP-binding protein